jgi:hypothetical protein
MSFGFGRLKIPHDDILLHLAQSSFHFMEGVDAVEEVILSNLRLGQAIHI